MHTIEERRKLINHAVIEIWGLQKAAPISAALEEIFSMADSWHEMSVQMKRMADAQEETMNMHKRMMMVPLTHPGGEA